MRQGATAEREAVRSIYLRDVGGESDSHKQLFLFWCNVPEGSMPLSDRVVTEWAAVGIACVLVLLYTGLRVLHVTQAGDTFDYWVGNDIREFALEVSGTVEGNLAGRHAAKVHQLRRNPYGVDGYVAVTRFASLEAIFSFNQHQETGG